VRILLSNDDGIHAPGLAVLEEIARELTDDIWIVAPEMEQSGASHSLTFHNPLRLREVAPRKFAVHGTPGDCIVLGVKEVLGNQKPDLILSGVNRGQNLAEDVTYSGTVAAAMEGTLIGIPSIALSQVYDGRGNDPVSWDAARHFAPDIIRRLVAVGWGEDTLINVNFPALPVATVKGVRVAAQGRRHMGSLTVDARKDPRGNSYYWIGYRNMVGEREGDTDLSAIREGHIAVTPLHLDLTYAPMLGPLRRALAEKD